MIIWCSRLSGLKYISLQIFGKMKTQQKQKINSSVSDTFHIKEQLIKKNNFQMDLTFAQNEQKKRSQINKQIYEENIIVI